ncbi:hypothetical protein SLEP1_g49277 [Rubroshorea leprosula]|uniref:Disease resistance protein n=1 Tax=Rubroshorea leprosula TaxID=152421 RepID=A0AAV5LWG1_9ROSI|nr:hypothetical protein SLEP1_g49277 [Rubroshorea leprosula]
MGGCPGIKFIPDGGLAPSLTDLAFLDCKNLKSLPRMMYQLKSLQRLRLEDCLSIEFIPDGSLPTNLTDLRLDCMNLKSIPNTMCQLTSLQRLTIPGGLFQNLNSLQKLWIIDCPKLQSLPGEAFPPSLGELYISRCPLLRGQRFEAKGDYWTLTRAIPNVEIDEDEDLMFEELGAC